VYCQIGQTRNRQIQKQFFYNPRYVYRQIYQKWSQAKALRKSIDYLTFVPNGEPTLDLALGGQIALLKPLQTSIAILTNSSLLAFDEIRHHAAKADLVSLKIDAMTANIWQAINRPHPALRFETVIQGILQFVDEYKGTLITETMLVKGLNDEQDELQKIAQFLSIILPSRAYIGVPSRPPAERWVKPPTERTLNTAYHVFGEKIGLENVEYLIGYEGNTFVSTGNVRQDLLGITSVHPMRKDAVKFFLDQANATWDDISALIQEKQIVELTYRGHTFYLKALPEK
jgi:wyosine [tRNA(Phe)-imidazoG37] synthetase (radical SAM superfamily)